MKTADDLPERQRSPLTATAPGLPAPALAALVERLVLWTPGLSDVEARAALSECAREFCSRTNCWTVPARFGPCLPTGAYPVANVPAGAVVLRVREPRGSFERRSELGWGGLPGPRPFYLPGLSLPVPPYLFGRGPAPVLALAPEIGGEDVAPEIVERWGDAFVEGARAHLCTMTGRAWSDPQAAALHGRKYDAAVSEARAAFEVGGVPSHLQSRSRIPFYI